MSDGNDWQSKLKVLKQERQAEAETLTPEDLETLMVQAAQEEQDRLDKKADLGQKISAALTGRTLSPEHKQALSDAKKGSSLSEAHKAAIGAGHIGNHLTDEHKKHCSEGRKGWWAGLTPEQRAEIKKNMSKGQKGKPGRKLTPEQVAKMVAGRQATRALKKPPL